MELFYFFHVGNCKVFIAMTTHDELSQPLLKEFSNPKPRSRNERTKKKKLRLPWAKILSVCYSFLLCWQLVGTCLYFIRCLKCFKEKSSTFLCDRNAAFLYSEELEVAWLITQSILVIIVIVVLKRIPAFLGYKAIFHRLKFLPSFFTLVLLLIIALSRYVMLLAISPKTLLTVSILIGFAMNYMLTVVAVGILNYTQLNFLKRQYPIYVFVLSKLTVLVIFLVNFTNFVISLIAVTWNVQGFPQAISSGNSSDFNVISTLLQDFGVTSFRFKVMSFFWSKLFIDDKCIF